jgi:outer membrane protein assembly factor BamB
VRAPFRVQWFGDPGYEHMVDRHHAGSSPLAADGRLFVPTRQGVHAFDAYNGTELWFYALEDAAHPHVDLCPGNAFIGPQGYYIASDDVVRLLDVETGKLLKEYKLPPAEDGQMRTWGYLAVVDGVIVGSRSIGYLPVSKWSGDVGPVANSDILFGMDQASGKVLWTYPTTWFRSNTPAIADGIVYIGYAQGAGGADLERALGEKEKYLKTFAPETQAALAKAGPWTMMLGALDIKTGKPKWQRIVDVAPIGGAEATLAYKDGMLLHFSGIGGDKSFDGLIRGRWASSRHHRAQRRNGRRSLDEELRLPGAHRADWRHGAGRAVRAGYQDRRAEDGRAPRHRRPDTVVLRAAVQELRALQRVEALPVLPQ